MFHSGGLKSRSKALLTSALALSVCGGLYSASYLVDTYKDIFVHKIKVTVGTDLHVSPSKLDLFTKVEFSNPVTAPSVASVKVRTLKRRVPMESVQQEFVFSDDFFLKSEGSNQEEKYILSALKKRFIEGARVAYLQNVERQGAAAAVDPSFIDDAIQVPVLSDKEVNTQLSLNSRSELNIQEPKEKSYRPRIAKIQKVRLSQGPKKNVHRRKRAQEEAVAETRLSIQKPGLELLAEKKTSVELNYNELLETFSQDSQTDADPSVRVTPGKLVQVDVVKPESPSTDKKTPLLTETQANTLPGPMNTHSEERSTTESVLDTQATLTENVDSQSAASSGGVIIQGSAGPNLPVANIVDIQRVSTSGLKPLDNQAQPSIQVAPTQMTAQKNAAKIESISTASASSQDSKANITVTPKANYGTAAIGNESTQSEQQATATDRSSIAEEAPSVAEQNTILSEQFVQQGSNSSVNFSGRIYEAFTGGERAIEDAEVQILGTPWIVKTDSRGVFTFDQKIQIEGVLPVVITKSGYLKRRVDLRKFTPVQVELVAENSVALSVVAAGDTRQPGTGFVFGQIVSIEGENLEGFRIEVQGLGAVSPIYLDDFGAPKRDQKTTGARGQFMLLNIYPGTYLVSIIDRYGRERAPHTLYVGESEGIVRKLSLGEKSVIQGRVMNATSSGVAVDSAKVRLFGSEQVVETSKDGRFSLGPLYVDCNDLNYIQVEKSGFYRNRVDYACSKTIDRNIFVFPASHIDGLATDSGNALKATSGVIVGHVSFHRPVKMQLWGPEEMNPDTSGRGLDYYFDADGVLNSSRNLTSKNENFVILDAPEGLSYIQAFNKENHTLSFWPIIVSASTVNVYGQ